MWSGRGSTVFLPAISAVHLKVGSQVFTFGSVQLRTCLSDADVDVSVSTVPAADNFLS